MTRARTKDRGLEGSSDAPEERAGYEVLDPPGHSIGRAERLFFNRHEGPEYVRVRVGRLFAKHVPIPVQDVAFAVAVPDARVTPAA